MFHYRNKSFKNVAYGEDAKTEWFGTDKPKIMEQNALANLPYIVDGDVVVGGVGDTRGAVVDRGREGLEGVECAADELRALVVALDLGHVRDQAGVRHVPPIAAGPVVDTTGAGDAFNGGFACALSQGMALNDALDLATAVAAISVTREGTAASMPTQSEVLALLRR